MSAHSFYQRFYLEEKSGYHGYRNRRVGYQRLLLHLRWVLCSLIGYQESGINVV